MSLNTHTGSFNRPHAYTHMRAHTLIQYNHLYTVTLSFFKLRIIIRVQFIGVSYGTKSKLYTEWHNRCLKMEFKNAY